jgi:hypothetical protein
MGILRTLSENNNFDCPALLLSDFEGFAVLQGHGSEASELGTTV